MTIEAPLPEALAVSDDSRTIGAFLNGLVPFFRTAQELERKARMTLATAKGFTLPIPGDIDADATLQVFIRGASAEKKAVEVHWAITSAVSQLHKKLVAARQRSVLMLEEAGQTAQRLHNQFADEAKRRAQAEQDRVRREAEQAAQTQRDAEIADLEAEALASERQSAQLSERERAFVQEVYRGRPPMDAACRAGYKEWAAQAARLMTAPKIVAALDGMRQALAIREQAAAVKDAPLAVEVPVVAAEVTKVGSDRTRWGAEVYDAEALRMAVLDPVQRVNLGIPIDVLRVDEVRVNQLGNQLHEAISAWPGCRSTKKTTTV